MSASGVDVRRGEVFQALVIALMVIVADKRINLGFEITGQEVVFQQDAVFERLVPAFDLALGLGMIGRTANMAHALGFDKACHAF